MQETEAQKRERHHQEDLQRLRGFRPIDDTFMRGMFKDNIPLAELVLRIIVGKPDLILTKCETQADLEHGQFVWMHMPPTARERNMISRFSALTMELTRTGQDIIPA